MSSTNNKRIAKNSLALYFRMLFTMIVSLYTSRVVLDVLGIEDFGIYNVVGGVVVLFSFLKDSLSGATARFLTYEHGTGDNEKLKKVFSNSLAAHIILSLVVLVLAETIGLWFLSNKLVIPAERMYAAHFVYQFSVLGAILSILTIPYNASIIANEKMQAFAFIGILQSVLKLIIVFLLLLSSFDKLIVYAALTLLVSLVIAFMYRRYCMRNFAECHGGVSIDKKTIKPLLFFSSWDLYGNMSVVARGQGINIVQNLFFGPLINAAGGVATQVQTALESFANNFLMAVRPQIVKNYASGAIPEMIRLIINASKFSFFLLLLMTLPLVLENEFVLNLWLKQVPDYSIPFTQLCLINTLISIIFRPIMFSIHATGRIKRMSFFSGTIYLLVLPITYCLFKLGFPPLVPYIVNIVLVLVASLINLTTLKSQIPDFSIIQFLRESVLICILVGALACIPSLIVHLQIDNDWIRFLSVCTTSTISIIVLVYVLGVNKDQRHRVVAKVRSLIRKK